LDSAKPKIKPRIKSITVGPKISGNAYKRNSKEKWQNRCTKIQRYEADLKTIVDLKRG
jgi:hypothetical protein